MVEDGLGLNTPQSHPHSLLSVREEKYTIQIDHEKDSQLFSGFERWVSEKFIKSFQDFQ